MKNRKLVTLVILLGFNLMGCSLVSYRTAPAPAPIEQTTAVVKQEKGAKVEKTVEKKNLPAKKMTPKTIHKTKDQALSLWHKVPSTQWVINDMKQEDLG